MHIYLKQAFKLSLTIIYFSNPSMYENNFWYLFDVKKLNSLNYDNLRKYYVNLEGFLKPINFFDLDSIDSFSNLKDLQEILSKEKKTATNILNFIKELNCSKCIYCI
jgi:hypothetical protein